jgi:hypothetical protein
VIAGRSQSVVRESSPPPAFGGSYSGTFAALITGFSGATAAASNNRLWTPPTRGDERCVDREIGCSRLSGLLGGARELRATMEFARRGPIACSVCGTTNVIGLIPTAVRTALPSKRTVSVLSVGWDLLRSRL